MLGTLQDASQLLAANGDAGPVRTIASVIGQEGQQNGWYRGLLGLQPSEKPFLTTSTAAFAFSALQGFVDSCPFDVAAEIDIPIFPALAVLSGGDGADVRAENQVLRFRADLTGSPYAGWEKFVGGSGGEDEGADGLFVTYLTGQNVPVSEPVVDVAWEGNVVSFGAFFPFEANVMEGLSIAALTVRGDFEGPDDVPGSTLAAPGLIQVNAKFCTDECKK